MIMRILDVNIYYKVLYAIIILLQGLLLTSCSSTSPEDSLSPSSPNNNNLIHQLIEQRQNPDVIDDASITRETQQYITQSDPESLKNLPNIKEQDYLENLPNDNKKQQGNQILLQSPLNEQEQLKSQTNIAQVENFTSLKQRLLQLLENKNNQNAELIRKQLEQNRLYGTVQPEQSYINTSENPSALGLDTPHIQDDFLNNEAQKQASMLLRGQDVSPPNNLPQKTDPLTQELNILPKFQQKQNIIVILPLSGQHGAMGQSLLEAIQLALLQQKNSRNIAIIPLDNKGTPQGTIKATQQALTHQAHVIIGPVFSKNVRAMQPYIAGKDVTILTFSNDKSLSNAQIYPFGYDITEQVEVILSFLKIRKIENIGIFVPDTAYGNYVRDIVDVQAQKHSMPFVAQKFYNYNSGNFSNDIMELSRYREREQQSLKGQRAVPPHYNALFLAEIDENNIKAIASQLDFFDTAYPNVLLIGFEHWRYLDKLVQEDSLEGAIFTSFDKKRWSDFVREYANAFKKNPHPKASISYDMTAFALYLLNQPQTIQQTLSLFQQTFKGIDGEITIKSQGIVERNYHIYQIRNKKTHIVK